MEAKVLLAIYTKVQNIYGDEETGKFLSYPTDYPYSFSPESLSPFFGDSATEVALSLERSAEFSRILNTPVAGTSFPSLGVDTYLWEVYEDILNTAIIADQNLSESELNSYRQACDYLFTTDEFGIKTNTAIYNTYCSYKDRFYILKEQLANLSSASINQNCNSEAINQKRKEITDLETEWNTLGYKNEVEKKLTLINNFISSSPAIAWDSIASAYNKDATLLNSLTKSTFAPTYLYPSDALNQEWNTINISKNEFNSLCNEAPSFLKAKFGTDSVDEEIECISFEYRSVVVQRPWMDFSVFQSRLWRFPENMSHEAISYGEGSFAGRFPAYVCALFLTRNLKVTYSSGKTETSFTSNTTKISNEVSVLAYICKHLPLCPNPDNNANWPTINKTSQLNVIQVSGGYVKPMFGDTYIGNGQIKIGSRIKFTAIPDPGFVLSGWTINGIMQVSHDYTIEYEMPEIGLKVVPKWEIAEVMEGINAVIEGTTLVSLSGAPKSLDMNKHAELCKIKVINSNAFKDSPDLCSIVIGNNVEIIGENAFSACRYLESISIPKSTRTIHRNAFSRDNYLNDPIIKIDPENEVYSTVSGVLEEKHKVKRLNSVHCKCGTAFFYENEEPAVCPNCESTINLELSQQENIRIPDSRIPFKLNRDECINAIKSYISGKTFVSKDFKAAADVSEITLRPVYVPYWEWNIQANGKFHVTCEKEEKTDEKDDKGNPVTKKVTYEFTEEASAPEKNVQIPSSKIVKSDALRLDDKINEDFTFHNVPQGTTFELYSRNKKESLKEAEQSVIEDLKNEVRKRHAKYLVSKIEGNADFIKEFCRLTLNPIWIGCINYKNKKYPIYVNGYNGKITSKNNLPKNWKSIVIVTGIITAIISIIVLICIWHNL